MLIIANWKMNKDIKESNLFLEDFFLKMSWCKNKNLHTLFAPSYPMLHSVNNVISNHLVDYNLGVCAQNCHHNNEGAFTGEVSAKMLNSLGVSFVILGHSERRQYFFESDDILLKKLEVSLENNLSPIFCFGESKEDRVGGDFLKIIQKQLLILQKIPKKLSKKIILAYEPIWAIGTGMTPTLKEIEEVHVFVKGILENAKILYGGSLNSKNSKDILNLTCVDGGLIGGASLNVNEFVSIIRTANEIS